jgi:putative FmdB family regulatory protein
MPTYEFRCSNGHDFEQFYRKISDAESTRACPTCGVMAERRISGGAGLQFKGSGFYLTDYGKNAHRGGAKPDGAKADGAKPEGAGAGGEGGGEKKAASGGGAEGGAGGNKSDAGSAAGGAVGATSGGSAASGAKSTGAAAPKGDT